MNILIIGNGFDLAHGLPTKYGDFLDFCKKLKKIYTNSSDVSYEDYKCDEMDKWEMNEEIKTVLLEAYANRKASRKKHDYGEFTTSNKFLNEISELIFKNTWFEYFLNHRNSMGENWIDLEKEISIIIRYFDEALTELKNNKDIRLTKKNQVLIDICSAAKLSEQEIYCNHASLINFTIFLDEELGNLIHALEIYIAAFVNNIAISKKNADIENKDIDHVLSFNYSNTYERLYCQGKNIECNYIHGKAENSKGAAACNLVLGIDEFLDDDRKDVDLELLSFKKYYQRIYKSTGNQYLDWVDKINEDYTYSSALNDNPEGTKKTNHTLYILGHSLDITDKDILRLFLCNDNIQIKIFYRRKTEKDKTHLAKLIKNLILIMGQEELIRRTGGIHKTIEFVPQTL